MPCWGLMCRGLEPASVHKAKRYRRLVPQLFPADEPALDGELEPKVIRGIEKLTEYAEVNPDLFPKISRKIFRKAMQDLKSGALGHVRVAVLALKELLLCHVKAAPLTAQPVVMLVQALLAASDPRLDSMALSLLDVFVGLQTQGSRWWSDQLDLFIPALGALMSPDSQRQDDRRSALTIVKKLLASTVKDAHLPSRWPILVDATIGSMSDHPGPSTAKRQLGGAEECACEAERIMRQMCAMSPTSANRTLDGAMESLSTRGCWDDTGEAPKGRLREAVLTAARAGLLSAGQAPMLFSALASHAARIAKKGELSSSLVQAMHREACALSPSDAIPALVRAVVMLPEVAMHVPYLGPQHSAVIDVMRAVAIRASTSLPLLDSLGAAAQQLPHNDPAGASYALDGMLLLLQKDPALEPTPIASLLLSAATPSFLRDGSTRSTRLRAHVVPPPLIRALLSVVVPSRAPWDDATRVAALRVLDAAIGSVDGVLSERDCGEMCSGLAKLWEQGSQQRQLQLRIPGLKPRTHIAAGPLAWAAGEAVKRAVGHAPREVMVSFAWLAASLRSCQASSKLTRAAAYYVSDKTLEAMASLAPKAASAAIRRLRSGCGDTALCCMDPTGATGPWHWESARFQQWRADMDAALAGPSAAEASSAHEHAAWCQALARAMGQGNMCPGGASAVMQGIGQKLEHRPRVLLTTLTSGRHKKPTDEALLRRRHAPARPVEQAMGAEDEKPVTGAATVALLWEISDAATDHGGDPVT